MLSGFNSPAISSPSCEIRNELYFPPLPPQQQQQQQIVPQQQILQVHPEQAKIMPKISQLSELEQQLSKLHQRPVTQQTQQQTSSQPSYSEAVRQSPTTVQQQFPQQSIPQQIQSTMPTQQPVSQNLNSIPIASTQIQQSQTQVGSSSDAKKVSRFQVSKVEEQKQQQQLQQQQQQILQNQQQVLQNQQQVLQNQFNQMQTHQAMQRQIVNSPEVEMNLNYQQQMQQQHHQTQQNQPQQQLQPSQAPIHDAIISPSFAPVQQIVKQPSQAQGFFQQHAGGVVSKKFRSIKKYFLSFVLLVEHVVCYSYYFFDVVYYFFEFDICLFVSMAKISISDGCESHTHFISM